jgi:transcriptional regulator with XRE-family HTH domain
MSQKQIMSTTRILGSANGISNLFIAGSKMTVTELIELRKRMGLSQADMATGMGLGSRAYQEVEARSGELKQRHRMLAERFTLAHAVVSTSPEYLPSSIRTEVIGFLELIVREEDRQKIRLIG